MHGSCAQARSSWSISTTWIEVCRPDGCLIHVGRRDFQVKIRGFRIDVSEVENALRAITGISDAVVVGREMDAGEQRLIAYFVASPKLPISGSKIREYLARVLPDYMIPSVFVPMEAIPQTVNGKADRLRLPLPARDRRDLEAPLKAPGSAIEAELAAMWAEVLGLEQVGTDDAFLNLGGDSLQAGRIAARVAARFKLEISIRALLDSGTVAQMAKVVAAALENVGRSDAVKPARRGKLGSARHGDVDAGEAQS